jgi:hypothetical protein
LQSKGIDYDEEFLSYSTNELAKTVASYQKQQQKEQENQEENWDWLDLENPQTA